MKWHCGVCLYIYKWLGFFLKSNKCPVLLQGKSTREGSQASICCEPVDERTEQIFVKQGAIENLYGKMPCLTRFRHGTTGHTMRPKLLVVTRTFALQKQAGRFTS